MLVSGSRETWIGSWRGGGEAKGARTSGASATLWKRKKGRENELGNCSWECTWALVVRKKKEKKKKEGNSETNSEGMQRAPDAKPKPKPNVGFLHTIN